MADGIEEFKEQYPSLESYWRAIILFGRNVASYKFALAKSILEIVPSGKTEISLEELAKPFSKHICKHLMNAPKQSTSKNSLFLQACKDYNNKNITYKELIDVTVQNGFNYVIDAFHVVNNGQIPVSFYTKDYNRNSKKIILTDNVYKLNESPYSDNFLLETESRWNLVETAWELGISRNLLNVRYDDASQIFFIDESFRRKDVTSARGALNGYQKGKCFYCFDDISINDNETCICDVDHFFPHTLQPLFPDVNLNGVWNLVLTCAGCNRGVLGKFAKVPDIKYLKRLHKRNEFLISSHHPLRETIMNQTGIDEASRKDFLMKVDNIAINALIHRWETPLKGIATF